MANPFLGETSMHSPSSVTDHRGDDGWQDTAPFHVAWMLLIALLLLTALKVSGFRAVVGLGRG